MLRRNPIAELARTALACFVCVALLATLSAAQDLNNLGHQDWTTENGLPQNSVHQILQTRDGYIWVATEGGVARFNGATFHVFDQQSTPAFATDDTCCLAQDATGTLWIGTADGLVQYRDGAFRHVSVGDDHTATEALASVGSDLYVLNGSGIFVKNGSQFKPLALPSDIVPTAIAQASQNMLWIATSTQLFSYSHGALKQHATGKLLLDGPIQGIETLRDGSPCLLTPTSITLIHDGRLRTLRAGSDLPDARIQSSLEDSRGNLWVGTSIGLFVMPNGGTRAEPIQSLGANSILSLFEDREGDIWAGTDTAGLHILRRQNFHTVTGLSEHIVTTVAQATDGAIWAGTNGDGLDRWQNGRTQHYSTANGLLSNIILALAPGRDGSIWAGTPDGLNHIDGRKVEFFTSADGLPDDLIRSLLVDSDGSLWIGTRRGLAHWKDHAFAVFTEADGLRSNLIGTLVRTAPSRSGNRSPQGLSQHASQDLWIGTLDGLSRLHNGAITTYTTSDGLSGDIITSLLEDAEGTLWIGTRNRGLSRFTNGRFISMLRSDLPRSVDAILEDNSGNLWLSSSHGITRVPRAALIACGTTPDCNPHPELYGRIDGMPTEEASSIGHPSAWKDHAGILWFATRKGVAVTDPNHLYEERIPPPIAIESFTVDDEPVATSGNITIRPGHTRFAFTYSGLSFAAPSRVRYRYILEGFDKQWTEAGTRRTAYYTNLPPRHYRFRVQATNSSGGWSTSGAEIDFYVRPAFYRRVWFILLCLAVLAAIIVLLYRLRVHRLRSQFDAVLAERNRMAREIHDTLAQSFVGVSVQLELAAQLLAQSNVSAAHNQIDRTRAYVRDGLAEARRSIWDLRAITATDTLPTRLSRIVERAGSDQLRIHLDIGGTYHPLAPAVETEVLRIAQEALANIVRHSQATLATIELRYHSKRLTLTITDNGRGFDTSDSALTVNGHFGIQGMKERASEIGGRVTINSVPGKGTNIVLDAPIAAEKGSRTP